MNIPLATAVETVDVPTIHAHSYTVSCECKHGRHERCKVAWFEMLFLHRKQVVCTCACHEDTRGVTSGRH